MSLIKALTKMDGLYPGYINFSREPDGSVMVTVRGDPAEVEGAYVCGYHPHDTGKPGRCTPGDDRCNNYCNMAPEKGPMQRGPKPCNHVREGSRALLRLSKAEYAELAGGLDRSSQ